MLFNFKMLKKLNISESEMGVFITYTYMPAAWSPEAEGQFVTI